MIHVLRVKKEQPEELNIEELPKCPKCGSKAFVSKDIVNGFYFGWSVGCPRFCHNDGIHGTDMQTPEQDTYAIYNLSSREECIKKWNERVGHLKKQLSQKGKE